MQMNISQHESINSSSSHEYANEIIYADLYLPITASNQ